MKIEYMWDSPILSPSRRIMRYAIDCLGVEDENSYAYLRYLIGKILWLGHTGKLRGEKADIFKLLGKKSLHVLRYAALSGEAPSMRSRKKAAKGSVSFVSYPDLLSHILIMPHNQNAASYYGRGTKFCTTSVKSDGSMDQYTLDCKMIVYGIPRKGYPNSKPFALRLDMSTCRSKEHTMFSDHVIPYRADSYPDKRDLWHMSVANACVSQLYDTWVDKVFIHTFLSSLHSGPVRLQHHQVWSKAKNKFPAHLVEDIQSILDAFPVHVPKTDLDSGYLSRGYPARGHSNLVINTDEITRLMAMYNPRVSSQFDAGVVFNGENR